MVEEVKSSENNLVELKNLLFKSNQLFTDILEAIPEMIFIIDTNGHFVFTNKAWREQIGYSSDELKSFNMFDLVQGKNLKIAERDFNNFLKGNLLKDMELNFKTKEASYMGAHFFLLPVAGLMGNVIAICGIGKNKNEYKDNIKNLIDSEKKYKNIIENSPYVIYTADTRGMIRSINKVSKTVLGYDPEEIIGKDFKYFITEEAVSQISKDHNNVINGRKVCGETSFYRKDGEKRHLEFVSAPLIRNGKIVETFGAIRDITDYKRKEEQLRQMLEAVTDAVILTDLEGIITQVNNQALELYGFNSEKKLLGKSIFKLITTSNQGIDRESIHKAMELGPVRNIEYKLLRADGSEFWGESNVGKLKDNYGKPMGYISMTRDISERKDSEGMLKRSQEKLQSIVMAMPDGLFHINRAGVFQDEPMGHKGMPYYYQKNLIGKNLHDVLPCDFADKLLNNIKMTLDNGMRQVLEYRMAVPAENKEAVYEIRIVPFGVEEVVAISRDITERIQSEERLRTYQQQLRSLSSQLLQAEERERRRLATDLHDLIGQPLAVIKIKMDTWTDVLYSAGEASNLEQVLELLESAIRNTRSLTYDLSSPILYELGLEAGLESLLRQFKERYSLRYEYSNDRQEKPLEDEVRNLLYRCASELLMNVVKHAKAHLVKLYICREDSQIFIIIEDDGVGFSVNDLKGRLHKFGLFSIQERLKEVNGWFKIQSKLGHGTMATLCAPLNQTVDYLEREVA